MSTSMCGCGCSIISSLMKRLGRTACCSDLLSCSHTSEQLQRLATGCPPQPKNVKPFSSSDSLAKVQEVASWLLEMNQDLLSGGSSSRRSRGPGVRQCEPEASQVDGGREQSWAPSESGASNGPRGEEEGKKMKTACQMKRRGGGGRGGEQQQQQPPGGGGSGGEDRGRGGTGKGGEEREEGEEEEEEDEDEEEMDQDSDDFEHSVESGREEEEEEEGEGRKGCGLPLSGTMCLPPITTWTRVVHTKALPTR
ncbi:hypothetical protein INR49_028405, partial [Caranx melampygus]